MTNLFPLPHWAPALKRVPILLQALDEAFVRGSQFGGSAFPHDPTVEPATSFAPIAAPLSLSGEK